MSNITATRVIDAPKSAVWAVLADFSNIADWTSQVKVSRRTGEPITGVGEGRHCELAPLGSLDETITEYVPEELLALDLHNTRKLPIKSARSSFRLRDAGGARTEVTMSTNPTFKGGPVGAILGRVAGGRLRKAQLSLLGDLSVAATRGAKARA